MGTKNDRSSPPKTLAEVLESLHTDRKNQEVLNKMLEEIASRRREIASAPDCGFGGPGGEV